MLPPPPPKRALLAFLRKIDLFDDSTEKVSRKTFFEIFLQNMCLNTCIKKQKTKKHLGNIHGYMKKVFTLLNYGIYFQGSKTDFLSNFVFFSRYMSSKC